eukprot:TRINITY_DN469_c1_g2_i1.p1 TRINITY_DN469_c1_g2~~TRINITY_DN469_c1_g2_i1.p1  ORF type:complete len:638 (-),score=120.44 TRINITY_DN469_c1_g2_i1:503-2416(-)
MLTSSFSIIYLLIVLLLFGRVDADQIIDTQTLSCNGASGGVKVHQTVFSDTIKNVQWLGNKTGEKVIYLLTESLSLYRSVDDGKIFTSIENILANNGPNPEITLVIPTTSALKTWFLGRKGDLWSTSNLGVSYHLHPIKVVTIQPNPEDPSQALATVATNCTSFDCVYELWYTKDSVAWTKIKELVSDYFWGRNGKIFVESWKSKSVHYSRWDCYLSSSTDEGHTWKDVAQHVVGSAIGREVLWVVRKKSEDSPSLQLLSSRNRGDDPLNLALLPTELPQNMFTVLDVDEDFIILNIQHQDARWGNVYISDDTDSNFALSLERNPRNVHGHVDFMPLESIDGIYFANAYLDDISLNNNDLTTLASFTYAGSWNVINPPTKDANGQPIACPGCTLHFHLKKKSSDTEDTYGAFHSNMNALGLILATGNIGPFLSTSNTNLYLSDDGGVTWSEIGEGGHVYEFADHGGVIMKALDSTTTSSVQYTWDQGKSWTTCDFGINPTEFHQILSEQTSTGLNFLLYGATSTQGSMKGIVMAIDLDDDKPRQCDTSPGSSDYEFWSLADTSISGMATQCFLGETKAIRRRVPSVACYDPLETQDTNVTKICECTLADYEYDAFKIVLQKRSRVSHLHPYAMVIGI